MEQPKSPPSSQGRATILIVDDESEILEFLAIEFQSDGHDVVTAKRPESALELARANVPDLIISDMMMPGLSGVEFLEQLKIKKVPSPVFFISGNTIPDKSKIEDMGAVGFLEKPFSYQTLLKSVTPFIQDVDHKYLDVLKALVCHPYSDMCDIIRFNLESQFQVKVYHACTEEEALTAFRSRTYDIILTNDTYKVGNSINLFKQIGEQKNKPLVLFIGSELPVGFSPDVKSLIKGYIAETKIVNGLKDLLVQFVKPKSKEVIADYCSISIRCLVHFSNLDEDIYIQLPSGRYLKLFSKGDQVEPQDIGKYERKGVKNLFFKKKVISWALTNLDGHLPFILENIKKNEAMGVPFMEDEADGESAKSLPPEKPLTEEEELFLSPKSPVELDEKVKSIIKVKGLRVYKALKGRPQFKSLMKKVKKIKKGERDYIKEHAALICQIGALIAYELQWKGTGVMESHIAAALTHDLLLAGKPQLAEIRTKDEADELLIKGKISEEDHKLFMSHPKKMADLLEKMVKNSQDLPVGVIKIVDDHHELPDGKGFPRTLTGANLSQSSALFIVAHDMAHAILSNENWDIKTYFDKMKKTFRGGAFTKILTVLGKISSGV